MEPEPEEVLLDLAKLAENVQKLENITGAIERRMSSMEATQQQMMQSLTVMAQQVRSLQAILRHRSQQQEHLAQKVCLKARQRGILSLKKSTL